MHGHRNRCWLGFGDVYHCCTNCSRWCDGEERMTAAEEEEVDTYKVAQVVVVAGEEERRGRIILVDTSLV